MSRQLFPFLILLFCGTVCSSMIVPYMSYFLVEGLNHQPRIISLYSLMAFSFTIIANRQFAHKIDAGARVHPLLGLAAIGYLIATASIVINATLWMVLTLGVLGFGVSSSAVSTMFSLGGSMAERRGVDRQRFNAYMRATTSTAWMIGPALSFLVADTAGPIAVFRLCLAAGFLWLILWWWVLPKDITAPPEKLSNTELSDDHASRALWIASAFIFCLSLAHSLTFSALPLFYVREVGLPGYAPGVAFSIKTFVEVIVIFRTPMLIARFGMQRSLLVTSMLAIVTIALLASVQSFGLMLAGAALEGLYYGLFASLGISYIQSFAHHQPAKATALYWNTLMVSSILAGPAVGFIAQTRSFQVVIIVASGVAFCSVITLLIGIHNSSKYLSTES